MAGLSLNTEIIARLSGRISYLNARNDLLAQNIAHLETPNYKTKDLEFLGFVEEAAAQAKEKDNMYYNPDVKEVFVKGDPKPNGNDVNMEQQMANIADNSVEYMVATEVIKKNLALLKFSASDQ